MKFLERSSSQNSIPYKKKKKKNKSTVNCSLFTGYRNCYPATTGLTSLMKPNPLLGFRKISDDSPCSLNISLKSSSFVSLGMFPTNSLHLPVNFFWPVSASTMIFCPLRSLLSAPFSFASFASDLRSSSCFVGFPESLFPKSDLRLLESNLDSL